MRAILTFIVVLAGCQGCHQNKIAIEPPPAVAATDGGDPCSLACTKLCLNSCQAGCSADPDAGPGSRCARVCQNDQAQGAASQLDPSCILNAKTVDDIKACGVACQ